MSSDYARESRANPTTPENRLWNALRNRQLGGFKFRRQHSIVDVRPDFFCAAVALAVEIDGHTHDVDDDAIRDANLLALGITTVRFSNTDVMQNLEGVCLRILEVAMSLPPRIYGGGQVR